MVNIIIDTNIFRKNPKLDSAAFDSVRNLAKDRKITIHLPYFIEKEHLSQRDQEYNKELENILTSLQKLNKKKLSSDLKQETNKLRESIGSYAEKVRKFIIDDFDEWLLETHTVRYKIDLDKTMKVFEAYFKGYPPFPEMKSRKDIPDSFIYETIKDLSKKFDNLHFVCEDSNLKKAVESLKNVRVYNSLEEYVESDVHQILLKEEIISSKFITIKGELNKYHSQFEEFLKNNIEYQIKGDTITSCDIPDDNNEATIEGIYEPTEININYDSTKYYGEGIVIVPFELYSEVSTYYYLFKSDYYSMNEERARRISVSDHNDHYYEVEEDFYIRVTGNMSIKINIKCIDLIKDQEDLFDFDTLEIDIIEEKDIVEGT